MRDPADRNLKKERHIKTVARCAWKKTTAGGQKLNSQWHWWAGAAALVLMVLVPVLAPWSKAKVFLPGNGQGVGRPVGSAFRNNHYRPAAGSRTDAMVQKVRLSSQWDNGSHWPWGYNICLTPDTLEPCKTPAQYMLDPCKSSVSFCP